MIEPFSHTITMKQRFKKYTRIPMRDIVEEENVAKSVREACEVLGELSRIIRIVLIF